MQRFIHIFWLVLISLSQCDSKDVSASDEGKNAIVADSLDSDNGRPVGIAELPKGLGESSGLEKTDYGSLLSHNDSGGKPRLFEFSMEGEMIRKIEIEDAKNRDWEDIAMDSLYVYISDTGNNSGNRDNLMIYRVSKKQIANKKTPKAEKIKFSYPEQTAFKSNKKHNFDCEAILTMNEHIYLFTKNRGDRRCSLYRIPALPGEYEAQLISNFDTKGLITGADINPNKNQIALIGYNYVGINGYEPFLWTFSDFKGDDFFTGKGERTDFTFNRQTEGICYLDDTTILFTEEEENVQKSFLYEMKVK